MTSCCRYSSDAAANSLGSRRETTAARTRSTRSMMKTSRKYTRSSARSTTACGPGQAAQALRRPPTRRGRAPVVRQGAARGADHLPLRVEEDDGDLEDRGDAVDQLADVLLLHDELQQLDLERGGPSQRLHVARRGRIGFPGAGVVLAQRRLELLGVAAHLVLQSHRGLEQPEVRLPDVHPGL